MHNNRIKTQKSYLPNSRFLVELIGHTLSLQCVKRGTTTGLIALAQLVGKLRANGRRVGERRMAEAVQVENLLAVGLHRTGLEVAGTELLGLSADQMGERGFDFCKKNSSGTHFGHSALRQVRIRLRILESSKANFHLLVIYPQPPQGLEHALHTP